MLHQLKNRNFYMVFGADLFLISLALLGAYLIRFEFNLDAAIISQINLLLPFILLFKATVFLASGLYRGMWRYSGLLDMQRILRATFFSSLIISTFILFTCRFNGFSRAVFILDGLLTFLFIAGLRVGVRAIYESHFFVAKNRIASKNWRKDNGKRIFIIGAGDAGEKALRELRDNPSLPYQVVGFIDDDCRKQGRAIHSVPVLGRIDALPKLVKANKVVELLITIPSASGDQMRRVVDACKASNVPYKTLPGIGELINGKVSLKALRDVSYQDLLGRPAVTLNEEAIQNYLRDKRVLVTGAGGSIGSELCRQLGRFHPRQLILLDASEENLYRIQMELVHNAGFLSYVTILGAIQHQSLMASVFHRYQPEVVFHAAAYKHVPMLERNPWQAAMNNIRGSQVIMEQCLRHSVKKFVLVSTDKAVRPTNVMGASKRICELLFQAYMGNGTRMMAVRFGNVIGSSGSVIPLFRHQIAKGGPVTVTHPEVTRFFMTIPEASQLILQAGELGEGGEIFVLKMGTPVKIATMARDLIRLSGREPDRDIKIEFIGLRPGEKLFEELITEEEGIVSTAHDKIMVLKSNGHWYGHGNQKKFRAWLMYNVEAMYRRAEAHDSRGIKEIMKKLVPEYTMDEKDCGVLNKGIVPVEFEDEWENGRDNVLYLHGNKGDYRQVG